MRRHSVCEWDSDTVKLVLISFGLDHGNVSAAESDLWILKLAYISCI